MQEPAAPTGPLPSDETLNTNNPPNPDGAFSRQRQAAQAIRRDVDARKMANADKPKQQVGGPSPSKTIANKGSRNADAITARNSGRYRNT